MAVAKFYDPETKRVTYIAGYVSGFVATFQKCLSECKSHEGLTIPPDDKIRFVEYGPPCYQYMIGFEFVSETPPTGTDWYMFAPREDYTSPR